IYSLPALGKSVLPKMLADFTRRHDKARIGLHVHSSRTVLQAVASRRIDLGLSMIGTDHPGVDCRILCRVDAVCALPRGTHWRRAKQLLWRIWRMSRLFPLGRTPGRGS
ncbi:MAG: LysR substrate-binding domain-containing protein, partial [Alphaproteobacteria bacterium]